MYGSSLLPLSISNTPSGEILLDRSQKDNPAAKLTEAFLYIYPELNTPSRAVYTVRTKNDVVAGRRLAFLSARAIRAD